jgi:hypothetical protein
MDLLHSGSLSHRPSLARLSIVEKKKFRCSGIGVFDGLIFLKGSSGVDLPFSFFKGLSLALSFLDRRKRKAPPLCSGRKSMRLMCVQGFNWTHEGREWRGQYRRKNDHEAHNRPRTPKHEQQGTQ